MANVSEGLVIVKGVLCDIGECKDKDVVVPEEVTSVGDKALLKCSKIKSVTFLGCVTSIGVSAFSECKNLESVTFLGEAKEEEVYSKNSAAPSPEEKSAEKSVGVIIPGVIKKISGRAFSGCKKIGSVTFGNGVKVIGPEAFLGCTKLKRVIIPEGVDRIEQYAFAQCKSLKVAVVPNSVKNIGNYAFDYNVVKITRV